MSGDAAQPDQPELRIVSGSATDEELAAVVAVLTAALREQPTVRAAKPGRNAWALSQRTLRSWSHDSRWN